MPATGSTGPLSVLIVEDEVMIRMLLAGMLEELGHSVVGEAGHVDEALALVNSGLKFDVAILDLNLDGKTAEPIAKAVEARGLKFLFATGYGASGLPGPFKGRTFLQKPFAAATLAQALAALQDGS
jgi:CheY-like chemotaxis protein